MAAVPHPAPTFRPLLPTRIVTDGLLSDAQLESVVLAGQALDRRLAALYRIGSGWETVQRVDRDGDDEDGSDAAGEDEVLSEPVRFRRGWMLGDGTGCGKGRQVGAIILDRWLKGTKRALWLSQSDKLLEDARRDWSAIGGCADDVVPLAKVRQSADIPHAEGVLFATYATLRSRRPLRGVLRRHAAGRRRHRDGAVAGHRNAGHRRGRRALRRKPRRLRASPGVTRLVIARDNDAEGERAAERLVRRCACARVAALVVVPEGDDFNSDLVSLGPQALAARLAPVFRHPACEAD